jgi:hypothetical protein
MRENPKRGDGAGGAVIHRAESSAHDPTTASGPPPDLLA